MWTFTIRSPGKKPQEYELKPGRNTIGRNTRNDIVISDVSASRLHAVVHYDEDSDRTVIYDMGSTNGTFVNRERLVNPDCLRGNDVIRIGGAIINVVQKNQNDLSPVFFTSKRYTRELLLESLDQHAVLLYEVAHQLNTVLDIETALKEVSALMKRAMGTDKGEVILANQFNQLRELGFPTSIARSTIEQKSAIVIPDMVANQDPVSDSARLLRIRSAMCVPVVAGQQVIALIYMYKTDPNSRPFDNRDLQLAVAISHQASLTIQRMELLERVREEQRGRHLLQRFLSPQETEFVLADYLSSGELPQLTEQYVTILFVDIANSTGLAEQIGAKEFGQLLNQYYQEITDIVFENGGLVKYIGDGVLAVFGMNDPKPDPEIRAVKSGLMILHHLEDTRFGAHVDYHIGVTINSGIAMVGYAGSQERVELTALGDVVNVVHGMQRYARPNRLFIGQSTADAIEGKYRFSILEPIQVKDRSEPIIMYEVLRDEQH
jgi:class 3 adenylate cyclase